MCSMLQIINITSIFFFLSLLETQFNSFILDSIKEGDRQECKHSTEVAIMPFTQPPWSRFSAEIFSSEMFLLKTAKFMNCVDRLNPYSASARDFANAVGGKDLS